MVCGRETGSRGMMGKDLGLPFGFGWGSDGGAVEPGGLGAGVAVAVGATVVDGRGEVLEGTALCRG